MDIKKSRIILISLLSLGFTSTFTQIYLVREFLSVLYGNELVIGVVLACWMLLTGAGAYLGRFFARMKGKNGFLLFLQILASFLPLLTVLKLDLWRATSLPFGSMVEMIDILYAAFIIQMPFCLVNGFLFVSYSRLRDEFRGNESSSASYGWESLGSVIGGIIVNFFVIWYFGTINSLRLLLIVNIVSSLVFAGFVCRKRALVAAVLLFVVAAPPFFLADLVRMTHQWLYPGQQVICDRSTPYGVVTVTQNSGQLNFYENGLLLFSSHNEIFSEEAVHYAMAQHPSPREVLLISGGISGVISEVRKYHPVRIDYLELNPSITEIGKSLSLALTGPPLRVFNEDARRFLKMHSWKYDIALISLPEPSTLQVNRYYSSEFFSELKSKLRPGAVVSLSLASTADYVSGSAAKLNGSLFATLKQKFLNVLIVPGSKNYFLASDAPLCPHIARLIAGKQIPAVYTNDYYLDDDLLKTRGEFIRNKLPAINRINYDFSPVTFFYQLEYWTTYFTGGRIMVVIIPAVVLLLVLLSLKPVSFGMFTGGFTASSVSIMILLAFQVFYGYVFQMTGIMIMIFMAGLAFGAFLGTRMKRVSQAGGYVTILAVTGLFAMGFPLAVAWLHRSAYADPLIYCILAALTIFISTLSGLLYSFATGTASHRTGAVPENYSADLFGSAFGALLTSLLLLPLAGILYTGLFLGLINFLAIIVQVSRKIRSV